MTHHPHNPTLPPGWAWTTLDDAVDVLDSRRDPINATERDQRTEGKPQSELYPYYGATGQVGWIDDYIFDEELVLLGEDGAPFLEAIKAKAYLARGKYWVNNHAHVLRAVSELTINSYLMHYLNVFDYHGYVTGTTRLKLNQAQMRGISVCLTPLPEQRRIVAKIESLFTRLDAGVAALKRAQANLKRYQAAVLKAACEGRLTNLEDRQQNSGSFELPPGWRWATIGELTQHLTSGSRGWAKHYADTGSLFVRVGNFNRLSKTIDLTKTQFVNAPQTAEANRTRLRKRDLLITMTADVGMIGVVDENTLRWGDAHINQHVGLVRLQESEFADFVAYALASEIGQKQFREKQYGATKLGLNFEDIASLRIPLPPLAEQRRIVAEVERRLSVVAEMETTVAHNLARAGRLRQAILKRAFEGKLVAQDPNDEPAERLLERARAEKLIREQEKKVLQRVRRAQREEMEGDEHMAKTIEKRLLWDVLIHAKDQLAPEELFRRAGFSVATSENFDMFYEELREGINEGRIIEIRPNKSQVFLKGVK